MTKLSVGIVTYNSSDDIATCLTTLKKHTPREIELDIYVFDNLSPDSEKTRSIISKEFEGVHLIENSTNDGFGHGHNAIISQLDSDYHLILNADIEFKMNTLSPLIDYLGAHQKTSLITPEIHNTDGTVQYLPKEFPKLKYVLSSTISAFAKYRDDYTRSGNDTQQEMDISTGCFMLVRTEQLKEVGGFDDGYFLYFEDFDLSLRLRKFGNLIYHPSVYVEHFWHRDSKKSRKIFFIQIKSMLRFYRKWSFRRLK